MLLCMKRRYLKLFDSRVMAPKNIEAFYKDVYAALNESMTLKLFDSRVQAHKKHRDFFIKLQSMLSFLKDNTYYVDYLIVFNGAQQHCSFLIRCIRFAAMN